MKLIHPQDTRLLLRLLSQAPFSREFSATSKWGWNRRPGISVWSFPVLKITAGFSLCYCPRCRWLQMEDFWYVRKGLQRQRCMAVVKCHRRRRRLSALLEDCGSLLCQGRVWGSGWLTGVFLFPWKCWGFRGDNSVSVAESLSVCHLVCRAVPSSKRDSCKSGISAPVFLS